MGAFAMHFKFTVAVLPVLLLLLVQQIEGGSTSRCDLSRGRWVYDESYPLYNSTDCPFVERVFNCQNNGRPDSSYLKYGWKPTSCNLPRFNGTDFLERFKGKRLMFVGDSLSLNQWQSLTCMLHSAVPHAAYTLTTTSGASTFSFHAYNISLMIQRNAFLVDTVKEKIGRVLKLKSMSSKKSWKGIDMLIFNTWHWWLHTGRKQPWDFIQEGNSTYKDMDRLVAYEKGLRTWAKWVNHTVNPNTTKVFFQGVSPDHGNASEWGDRTARGCSGQQKPLPQSTDSYSGRPHPAEAVAEKIVSEISDKVYLLNLTSLSQLRKDGHPSIYGLGGHRAPDCTHWCLPGVPDTWNQLLYATLLQG